MATSRDVPRPGTWSVVAVTSLATLLANLNASTLAVPLPDILKHLHGTPPDIIWLPLAYLLPFAVTVPVVGKLADAWGHRPIFLWGLATFAVSSALSGVATGIPVLLVYRALAGIGAGMTLLSIAFITFSFPEGPGQAMPLSIWRVCVLGGTMVGPVAGGLLDVWLGWRGVFWPFAVLGAVAWLWGLTLREPGVQRDRRMDWAGGAAVLFGLSAFVVALNTSGLSMGAAQNRQGASAMGGPVLDILWAVFLLGLVTLLIRQRTAARPILDVSLYLNRRFALGNLGTLFICVAMFSAMFFVPLYLEYVRHWNAWQTALAILPAGIASVVFGVWGGSLTARYGATWPWAIGFGLMALGFLVLAQVQPDTPPSLILWGVTTVGAGTGLPIGPTAQAAMGYVAPAQAGEAAGVFNLAHNMGRPLGLGTLGALLAPTVVASYQQIFWATVAVMLVGSLLAFALGPAPATRRPEPAVH
jgi:MFS family permease